MKQAGNLTMSARELDRLAVIGRASERRLTQREAAERLGLSLRQVERLIRRYRSDGAPGFVSRKRGRRSNRKLSSALCERVSGLVCERYADFGLTFACEKLAESHRIGISRETLRRFKIGAELWIPRSQRQRRACQPRYRRFCVRKLLRRLAEGSPLHQHLTAARLRS